MNFNLQNLQASDTWRVSSGNVQYDTAWNCTTNDNIGYHFTIEVENSIVIR